MTISFLPSALDRVTDIISCDKGLPVVFLDYDGTLTPIVARPEYAILSDKLRSTLQQLTKYCKLAIISGRDLENVRQCIGIDNLYYAGSHGFDIAGPGVRHQQGERFLPILDRAETELHIVLDSVPGCIVERKRFSIAIHVRLVANTKIPFITKQVKIIHGRYKELRLSHGKKLFELQPAIPWHKGMAVNWLMQQLNKDHNMGWPLYIGDDTTDKDAFRFVRGIGTGILVTEKPQKTQATYYLNNSDEVRQFLDQLLILMKNNTDAKM